MPASHSFLVTAVQMSQASEATGTLGRLSVDGVELAEPHTPLWFSIQAAAVMRYSEGAGASGMAGVGGLGGSPGCLPGAPLFTEVEAGTQQNYDSRCKLGAMLPQQQRVARAAMWQQQQEQSAAGGYGGPLQFAGIWPPPPPPLMAQQGAAGEAILQPLQFAAGGYGGPYEVGDSVVAPAAAVTGASEDSTWCRWWRPARPWRKSGVAAWRTAWLRGGGDDDDEEEEEEEEEEDASSRESIPVVVPADATLAKRSWCCSRTKTLTALCR